MQRPEITFTELVQPGVSEIGVHHETSHDSGSVQQENFVVLKMLHDRIEVVLDTTERQRNHARQPTAAETDNLQQTQTSTFYLLKSPPNSAAMFRIFEKQVVTDNKTTITRDLVWTWDPELERFRSSPIDGGDVRPVPPPAKKPAATTPATQKPAEKSVTAANQAEVTQRCTVESSIGPV